MPPCFTCWNPALNWKLPAALWQGLQPSTAHLQRVRLCRRRSSILPIWHREVFNFLDRWLMKLSKKARPAQEAVATSKSHQTELNLCELLPVWWTRCLARGGNPLELHRAEIPDGRVASLRVVE